MLKIDLRSDTVTKPTDAMRKAMAQAPVGDDVFGEDPTVNLLQEKAAAMLGKEAALYVPSGTMANQICLNMLTSPGDEVICYQYAHIYRHEAAGVAVNSGSSIWPLPGVQGVIDPAMVAQAISPDNIHYPATRVVALENTSNQGSGNFYPLQTVLGIAKIARENGLLLHLDGARMFHACLAGGYEPKDLAAPFDTISFCLSKGLGAPVGSMVVSSAENIKKAVQVRKRLGGGMRQAGILAAAGVYALDNNIGRLADDHARAGRLARGLAELPGVDIDPKLAPTNIVIFDVSPSGLTPDQAVSRLAELGVGMLPFGGNTLRAVTHLDIDDRDIDQALEACGQVFG